MTIGFLKSLKRKTEDFEPIIYMRELDAAYDESKTPRKSPPKKSSSKLEILGLIKVELGDNSWYTVVRLVATVLTTFLGIRIINYVFDVLV